MPCKIFLRFSVFITVCFLLWSCASSDVSRTAATNVDVGVQNAQRMGESITNTDIATSYGNTSQGVKGAILGGIAGGVAGGLSSGVGVLPGLAAGAIFGSSYGTYIDTKTSTSDQLENRGLNIVELGDRVMIVVPSARVFEPMTSTIKPQAYSTLNLVANYINRYTKMLVKVAVYTARSGACDVDLALSQQQANRVVRYLQAAGANARLLYAVGYGGSNIIQRNDLGWDSSDNYRIEITFEKLGKTMC